MKALLFSALLAASASSFACGEDEVGTLYFAQEVPEFTCHLPGLQARLEISGGLQCALEITASQTAVGTCPPVATGQVVLFRLLYFVATLRGQDVVEVQLAAATQERDLREYSDKELMLSFDLNQLSSAFDDDADGVSNIEEICNGTNPLPD
jgi:hypothetical protein